MANTFKETEPLLSLDTGKDLSTATNPRIDYEKPDGTTGEWSASISGQNVQYQVNGTDLDLSGRWKLQAVVDFGTATKKGEMVSLLVKNPIKTT